MTQQLDISVQTVKRGEDHGALMRRLAVGRWPLALSVTAALSIGGCASAEPPAERASVAATQRVILEVGPYVVAEAGADRFPLASAGQPVPIVVANEDFPGVLRVAGHLQTDLQRVTQTIPELLKSELPASGDCVVVGTLGKSPLIDQMVAAGKLDVSDIAGQWEASLIQVVEKPWAGVDRALVIAGSDKRGTIYGMFDLSAQIGVSPWYYWADVPVTVRAELHVLAGRRRLGSPAVKYRGIFINDEQPSLEGWAKKEFGGFNSKFYERLFELMLRLRANYLWPAMWGKAFNLDDPKSPELADEYGIVMGTSHHEPMMRNQDEWRRAGSGDWNYTTNQANLSAFWQEGIRRMGTRESIVTIGMRGDGDARLSPNPDIPLLQTVLAGQRQILADVTGKDPATIPQVWTIYKEVQDYYEQGLRAPDDVTVMIADDNFGNIRMLPKLDEPVSIGGFGIYYHFDYVGSPRSYKWLNTNPLPRIWEQLHLAHEYGVDRIWLVNVGDLKLQELPTQFFLDYAWDPQGLPSERLREYTERFAAEQFGSVHAAAIGAILSKYAKFNARRKPELLEPETYSLVNYREAERVVADYYALVIEAQQIYVTLPSQYRDAFFQLVLYPVMACANLNDLHVTVGRNRLYEKQGRVLTNALADRAATLFARDAELSAYYNQTMANGKWNHIADQAHIGYTTWQAPSSEVMPEVKRLSAPEPAAMGLAVEGSEGAWPGDSAAATLPEFSPTMLQPAQYFELFNRGTTPFDFSVESGAPYVSIEPPKGKVEFEQRLWVKVDWATVPVGATVVPLTVHGPGGSLVVQAPIQRPATAPAGALSKVEQQGYVVMAADQFSRKIAPDPIEWKIIDDLGRTGSGVTPFPVTTPTQTPAGSSPRLEYDLEVAKVGTVRVRVYASPTMQVVKTGLKYAISFDDDAPKTVNIHGDASDNAWQERVRNNINESISNHSLAAPGAHVLKFWMVDPGIVLQKIVVETGTVRPSYLGPPTESFVEPTIPELSSIPDMASLVGGGTNNAGAGGEAGANGGGSGIANGGAAVGASGSSNAAAGDGAAGENGNPGRARRSSDDQDLTGGACALSVQSSQRCRAIGAWLILAMVGLGCRRRRRNQAILARARLP